MGMVVEEQATPSGKRVETDPYINIRQTTLCLVSNETTMHYPPSNAKHGVSGHMGYKSGPMVGPNS